MQLEDQLALQRQRANSTRDLLVVMLVLAVVVTFVVGMGDMLDDIQDRSEEALVDAGFPETRLSAESHGRSVAVRGDLANATEATHALDAVARVPGVAVVDSQIELDPSLPPLTLKPLDETPADAEQGAQVESAEAAAEPPLTDEGQEMVVGAGIEDILDQAPRVIAKIDGGNIVLKGVLKNTAVSATLLDQVDDNFTPDVIVNRIVVDGSVSDSPWVSQIGPMIAELKNYPGVEVGFTDRGINLLGEGPKALWDKIAELRTADAGSVARSESAQAVEPAVTATAAPDVAAAEAAKAVPTPSIAPSAASVKPLAPKPAMAVAQAPKPPPAPAAPTPAPAPGKPVAAAKAPTASEAADRPVPVEWVGSLQEDLRQMNKMIAPQIRFRHNKPQLADSSLPLLRQVAGVLGRYPGVQIGIGVHTDSRGTATSNQILTSRRAEQIKDSLVSYGMDPLDLVAQGFGASQPVASNATPQGRALNRRVEFTQR